MRFFMGTPSGFTRESPFAGRCALQARAIDCAVGNRAYRIPTPYKTGRCADKQATFPPLPAHPCERFWGSLSRLKRVPLARPRDRSSGSLEPETELPVGAVSNRAYRAVPVDRGPSPGPETVVRDRLSPNGSRSGNLDLQSGPHVFP